jgi:hypothetical protein
MVIRMELTNSEREALTAAVRSRHEALEFSRRIARENRSERARRTQATHQEREQRGRHLVESAGIDYDALEVAGMRDADLAQAFLASQRQAIVDHGSIVAQRQERTARQRSIWGRPGPEPMAAERFVFRSLVTLEIASDVKTSPTYSQPDQQFVVQVEPLRSMHNLVKVLAETHSTVARGFAIPALPAVYDIDFLFTWKADADVALNAITFVQPNGVYALLASWAAFAFSRASLDFKAGLDIHIQNPSGQGIVTTSSSPDDSLYREINIGWFDFLGEVDSGPFSDESDLIDNDFIGVTAGSMVIFDVWVALTLDVDGDATALLDFHSGDFGINVPAVFVPTYQAKH